MELFFPYALGVFIYPPVFIDENFNHSFGAILALMTVLIVMRMNPFRLRAMDPNRMAKAQCQRARRHSFVGSSKE